MRATQETRVMVILLLTLEETMMEPGGRMKTEIIVSWETGDPLEERGRPAT